MACCWQGEIRNQVNSSKDGEHDDEAAEESKCSQCAAGSLDAQGDGQLINEKEAGDR